MSADYKLTQYSHGSGCGCKIAPAVLDHILVQHTGKTHFPSLLVGNEERDDAAVFDWGGGEAVVSTTDFFMPIVDDPEDFGRIAAVNAISDIYAMGGTPLLAIAILGWPVGSLPPEVANLVVEGGRKACLEAGIPLAGGHSIDNPEPIFGLAVTGKVRLEHLKKNGGAQPGSYLFITKPLGVGIFSTAQKKGLLEPAHDALSRRSMLHLNKEGILFGQLPFVEAMTDVTGFGLLGHLVELCEASGTSAVINLAEVPLLDAQAVEHYAGLGCIPGGTHRNWDSYGHKVAAISKRAKEILCDPQTSGGLMVAVSEDHVAAFLEKTAKEGLDLKPIGRIEAQKEYLVRVEE
ncbi:MAG: selenide, water dikinase SelD [Haliscomenobacter sp.]|nr:selenide, water dikinase SelD [Haliscomenobacter sp.]